MLRIDGQKTGCGVSRREMLRIGGASAVGLSLPALLAARDEVLRIDPANPADRSFGLAKNVIFIWLQGGPPQHETFDPKPEAPAEVRGPFQPIHTNVPGIDFCELLPRTARIADKLAVIRSLSTGDNVHSSSGYWVLTGHKYVGPNARTIQPTDQPFLGSIVKKLKPSDKLPPLSSVWLPEILRLNENVTPAGQTAGILGRQWDPELFRGDPADPDYQVQGLRMTDIPPLRLRSRMSLLEQVERHFEAVHRSGQAEVYDQYQQQAFDLLSTDRARKAFAIQSEPAAVRERYGPTQWGQCLLLARRLVEAGVRMVHVNWCREPGEQAVDNPAWDTHAQNADRMEDFLCPIFDFSFTALIEDLAQRGLLDETLVVAVSEFGRTPKINAKAGRDHWGAVFPAILAGAGVSAAQVYGSSDGQGAYPASHRHEPQDLAATIFHLLGIDHRSRYLDRQGREHPITLGTPIYPLLGTAPATLERSRPGGDPSRLAAFDNAPLLNTDFSADAPLLVIDHGSRPKGWRATPLRPKAAAEQAGPASSDAFCVQFADALPFSETTKTEATDGQPDNDQAPARARNLLVGFGAVGSAKVSIPGKAKALVAQEIRNPRVGTYTLSIQLRGEAASAAEFQRLFAGQFRCRMSVVRYLDATKNAANSQEVAGLDFQPEFAATDQRGFATFQLEAKLDGPKPGSNFSVGKGLAVLVTVEKTTSGTLELAAGTRGAGLRFAKIELAYEPRGINDKVTV